MTQVIIPKAIYHSPLAQPNLFQNSVEDQKNIKCSSKGSFNLPKKSYSAFKFYKEKKQRQKERENKQAPQQPEKIQGQVKKFFKLKIKTILNQCSTKAINFQEDNIAALAYYDPNEAPAFVEPNQKQFNQVKNIQKIGESSEKKTIQTKQRVIFQTKTNKQNHHNFQENQFQLQRQEGRIDDPFIIYKKVNLKKTKIIKNNELKQASFKKKLTKEQQHNKKHKNQAYLSHSHKKGVKRIKRENQEELFQPIEIKSFRSQILKSSEKQEDDNEIAITQKGSDKKALKEQLIENNIRAHEFMLNFAIDCQFDSQLHMIVQIDQNSC